MKIAIASSGLGHVARGIESWAQEMFEGLKDAGVDVVLFAGPEWDNPKQALRALKRDSRAVRILKFITPSFLWRYGLKSEYGWEQFSFWLMLFRKLIVHKIDILHVQDPMLAYWCSIFRKLGLLRTKEILAHGTEELPCFVRKFSYVQHLAPWHFQHALQGGEICVSKKWYVIPNTVKTELFQPASAEEKANARLMYGMPVDSFVVGIVSAVQKKHKRIDYAISEFEKFLLSTGERKAYLVVAGAKSSSTNEIVALLARSKNVKILLDLPRDQMVRIYRMLDVFALTSLFEMQPMAILEAMSSGLPVIVNSHPALEWMICNTTSGLTGGTSVRMDCDGELAMAILNYYNDPLLRKNHGVAARRLAELVFSRNEVIKKVIKMYHEVLEA